MEWNIDDFQGRNKFERDEEKGQDWPQNVQIVLALVTSALNRPSENPKQKDVDPERQAKRMDAEMIAEERAEDVSCSKGWPIAK